MSSLTVFRIKSGVTDHDEIMKDRGGFRPYPIRLGAALLGIVYARRTRLHQPTWRSFFSGLVAFEGIDLRTAAAAAVLVIQRPSGEVFAITFGYGRWFIRDDAVESRFGLRVTLNAIDPESIRSIDHKRLEAISRQTREQLSRASRLEHFGVDVERDLLRAVTGTPKDETLGRRLAGADQLVVVGDHALQTLGAQLDKYSALAKETTYRRDFGFVDFIAEITDPTLRAQLDDILVRRLRRRIPESVWLAPPDIVDWDDVEGFKYGSRRDASVYEELELTEYFDETGARSQLTVKRLKDDRVICASASTGGERQQWSTYRCLVAEVTLSNDTFVLNEGKWYNVQRDFLQGIDEAIKQLEPTTARLPPCRQRSEKAYNQYASRLAQSPFALLDRKLVGSVSRGRIEVCDLYSHDRQWVHVKRYTGSGVLSHLFNQGVVSADVFQADRTFRQEFNDLLPPTHRVANPAATIVAAEYEVAFAIITPRNKDLRLPFFSKVTLRNAARLLQRLGYRVTLTQISTQ